MALICLPPVTKMTLPARLGMSRSGLQACEAMSSVGGSLEVLQMARVRLSVCQSVSGAERYAKDESDALLR